jgi:hypothetical protein
MSLPPRRADQPFWCRWVMVRLTYARKFALLSLLFFVAPSYRDVYLLLR